MYAELHDWLNRRVFVISKNTNGYLVKIEYQTHVFIDDITGYEYRTDGTIESLLPTLNHDQLDDLIANAKKWYELPIDELGTTDLRGDWYLSFHDEYNLRIIFEEYTQTPGKTDWLTVVICIKNGEFHHLEKLHVDYTCIRNFVEQLLESTQQNDSNGGVAPSRDSADR